MAQILHDLIGFMLMGLLGLIVTAMVGLVLTLMFSAFDTFMLDGKLSPIIKRKFQKLFRVA